MVQMMVAVVEQTVHIREQRDQALGRRGGTFGSVSRIDREGHNVTLSASLEEGIALFTLYA